MPDKVRMLGQILEDAELEIDSGVVCVARILVRLNEIGERWRAESFECEPTDGRATGLRQAADDLRKEIEAK